MSVGKKWLMTSKQLHRTFPSKQYKRGRYKVGGGRNGKFSFKFFRHKKYFKLLDGKISMRRPRSREIWYWD